MVSGTGRHVFLGVTRGCGGFRINFLVLVQKLELKLTDKNQESCVRPEVDPESWASGLYTRP